MRSAAGCTWRGRAGTSRRACRGSAGSIPRPALIVEAANASDVRTALRFAREHDLPLAVQSTGHGVVQVPDGGLLLKTNPMSAVAVDAGRRVARVGGGALWSDVIAAAAPHGLAPLSGSSPTVGVTGYTLGGGTGWLSRLYGFAADSVVRAEVVTADGRARHGVRRPSTRTCSGRCAAAAATSAS